MGKSLKQLLPNIQEKVVLAPYTTFKVGGPARYFYIAHSRDDLVRAAEAGVVTDMPYVVLGGGSNTLVADRGFDGLVVVLRQNKQNSWKFEIRDSEMLVVAEAGMPTGFFSLSCAEAGLTGFEWAQGIPGTIGGAVYGDAGSFGKSIAEVILSVEVLDCSGKEPYVKIMNKSECAFDYRESVFKKNKNLIILSAVFNSQKGEIEKIRKTMKEYMEYRKSRQPLAMSSAGSVFKNLKFKIQNSKLRELLPDLDKVTRFGLIPAGYLIDRAGCKGMKVGGAMVSPQHANFIVNTGRARAKDIFDLSEKVRGKVHKKFGLELEREIQLVGF